MLVDYELEAPNATAEDTAAIQRVPLRRIEFIAALGAGAFAQVDLVSVQVGLGRKLCVRKALWLPPPQPVLPTAVGSKGDCAAAAAAAAAAERNCAAAAAAAVVCTNPSSRLKPSQIRDFERERDLHRQAAGCPFIVQLFAAKSGAGEAVFLMEHAPHGPLTSLLPSGEPPPLQRRLGRRRHAHEAPAPTPLQQQQEQQEQLQQQQQQLQQQPQRRRRRRRSSPHSLHNNMPEGHARFYAGCVLLALRWLHERRILHRDIKPDNLLLRGDGYLLLSDMGCACQVPPGSRARGRSGTASHMAPEVAARLPHDEAADLYSLAVTLHQIVAGRLPQWLPAAGPRLGGGAACPGDDDGSAGVKEREDAMGPAGGGQVLELSPDLSEELRHLLGGLLASEPSERPSMQDVQQHAWFRSFDWAALQQQTMAAPRAL